MNDNYQTDELVEKLGLYVNFIKDELKCDRLTFETRNKNNMKVANELKNKYGKDSGFSEGIHIRSELPFLDYQPNQSLLYKKRES